MDHLPRELARLERMTIPELRWRYLEVFGEEASSHNKVWLVRRLAWRLQSLAEGGLSERAQRRAAELANDADIRMNPPAAGHLLVSSSGIVVLPLTVQVRGVEFESPYFSGRAFVNG